MRTLIGLIAVLLFLHFSRSAFAAVNITGVSSTVVNSQNDIIFITASASGLSSSAQYFQVLFTKSGESTNYFGLTQNLSGEWYKYKSSPSLTGDLQVYFYNFTPVDGAWAGTISAKLDIDDSGYKGAGNYIVKLAKYITSSSPTYSTNQYTIESDIPTPIPTNTPTPTSVPTLIPTSTPSNSPTPTKTLTPTLTPTKIPTFTTIPTSVLGESTQSGEIVSPTDTESFNENVISNKPKNTTNNLPKILMIIVGIIFSSACAILIFLKWTKKLT